jgi:hypothetical protein
MTPAPFPDEVRDRVTSYIRHQGSKSPDAIIDLVRTSQQKYTDIIAGTPDDVATRRPGANEWSLLELTRHVLSAQEGVAALVHSLARSEPTPGGREAGQLIDDGGEPLSALVDRVRALNARLLDEIANLPESPDLDAKANHPFFGPLNCKEWAAFQRVHDEDHIQHAQKILAAVR